MIKKISRVSIIKPVEDDEQAFEPTTVLRKHINTVLDTEEHVNTASKEQNNSLPPTSSRTTENFVLIWLNLNASDSNENIDDSITKLQHIVNSIHKFSDLDKSIDFLSDIKYEQAFMIISGSRIQNLVPLIEDLPKLRSIYVFDSQSIDDEQWIREHKKIKGIFTQIDSICDLLKKNIYELMNDLTPFSIIPTTTTNLDELDQSFMYTQILKEIILQTKHDSEARKAFVTSRLNAYENNKQQCEIILKFDEDYENHSALWWYSKEFFLYSIMNAALRTQNVKDIIEMGFFLHDLHREIERKYLETHPSSKLIVYRGQGMSNADFDKLKKNQGGLLSFNSFLSTSFDRIISEVFADSVRVNRDTTGILFRVEIDPSISSTPYTSLAGDSQFEQEQEVLFSMHAIFRLGGMREIDDNLWEVDLILTSDDDPHLKRLTDCIKLEIGGVDGWFSMGILLQKMGKLDQALEVYKTLLERTSDDDSDVQYTRRRLIETNIGEIHRSMGNYLDAWEHLDELLKPCPNTYPPHQLVLFRSYDGIACIYLSIGNYTMALCYFEKALEIGHNILPSDHGYLTVIYNHIALAHQSAGDYSKALSCYENVRDIQEKQLPCNHPNIAANDHNIGLVYILMGNYSKALSYFEKALEINQKVLPPGHFDLALNYNSISIVHQATHNLSLALSYAEKALEVQKSGPSNHPYLPVIYSSIAAIHSAANNYIVAISSYEKAIDIYQESHPADSADLARIYSNMGALHRMTNNHPTALLYLEKALHILEKTLPSNHPDWIIQYINIGYVYQSMGDHLKALSYMDKAIDSSQKSLSVDNPKLAHSYYGTAAVYESMNNYPKALSYYRKARDISRKILPPNHPDLITINNRILWVSIPTLSFSLQSQNDEVNNDSTAMAQVTRSWETLQKYCSPDTTEKTYTATDANNVHQALKGSQTSVSDMENMIQNLLNSPLSNHPSSLGIFTNVNDRDVAARHFQKALSASQQALQIISETVSNPNNAIQNDSLTKLQTAALKHLEKFLEMVQANLPPNDSFMAGAYNNIGAMLLQWTEYSTALSYFQKALDVLDKSFSNNSSMQAMTYSNMAKALAGLENYDQAVHYAQQAVNTSSTDFQSTEDVTRSYQDLLDQLRRKL